MKRILETLHGVGLLLFLAVYLIFSVFEIDWLFVTYPLRNLRK